MNIRELIDQLEDIASDCGDETDVRIAHQPQWPFEYAIGQIVSVRESNDESDEAQERLDAGDFDDETERQTLVAALDAADGAHVIYIGEGSQLGYLPGAAASELGWRR